MKSFTFAAEKKFCLLHGRVFVMTLIHFSIINLSLLTSGLSDEERLNIHQALLSTSDFVEATVFDRAKQHACDRLQDVWLRFLKEDLKAFLE